MLRGCGLGRAGLSLACNQEATGTRHERWIIMAYIMNDTGSNMTDSGKDHFL